jgi:hypothetical protein
MALIHLMHINAREYCPRSPESAKISGISKYKWLAIFSLTVSLNEKSLHAAGFGLGTNGFNQPRVILFF